MNTFDWEQGKREVEKGRGREGKEDSVPSRCVSLWIAKKLTEIRHPGNYA